MGVNISGERLHRIQQFSDGTHPVILTAFYHANPQTPESVSQLVHRQAQIPFSDVHTPRRLEGDTVTEKLFDAHFSTGEAIYIHDGFNVTIHTTIGPILVLVDTKSDPLLAGIIHKAKTLFGDHPAWNTDRRVFELSMLCFGNWGQKRYPLEAFKSFSIPKFVLGELIWTTNVADLECAVLSLGMQAVGQACGLNISWHAGRGARFSPYCHGEGPHAWNIVRNGETSILVDWTNYPPQIAHLFASAGRNDRDKLYNQFHKTYGVFPAFRKELYPPTLDQYDRLQSGDNPGLASRNSVVYRNDFGEYLGSCSIPGGWD